MKKIYLLSLLTLFMFALIVVPIKADIPKSQPVDDVMKQDLLALKKAYENPAQTRLDREKRYNAIREALLNLNYPTKVDETSPDPVRVEAIQKKLQNYEYEQKLDEQKQEIIKAFYKKYGKVDFTKIESGLEPDDYEPDDTHNQGEKLVDGFYTPKHNIYPAGDIDFFYFEADAGDVIEIVTKTPNPYWASKDDPDLLLPPSEADLDPYITLYLPDRTVLATDDDSGPGWDAFMNIQLPVSGRYYISVESSPLWDPLTVGQYDIGLAFIEEDGYEPDNDMASANDLVSGQEVTDHTIMPAGDVDFYKVVVPVTGAALKGAVVSTPSAANQWDWPELYKGDLDPALDIYDENGVLLWTEDDSYNPIDPELGAYDVEFKFSFLDAGTYYLKVYASPKATGFNTQVGSYDISLEIILPDQFEPDNTPMEANPIAYGDVVDGHTITSVLDGDMFMFMGNAGDIVEVRVITDDKCGDLDPGVALFGDGRLGIGSWGWPLDWLHSSMDDGEGLDARIVWGPLPYSGPYFLEVGADPLSGFNWWERSGAYTITLNRVGTSSSLPLSMADAQEIDFGDEVSGVVPRTGVVWPDDQTVTTIPNWYKFEGVEGQTVAVTVTTPVQYQGLCGTMQSDWRDDLNPEVWILDDGGVELANNKNIDPNNNWDDAELVYTLPATGTYYIKVDAERVPPTPLFQFFGELDSYGEFGLKLVRAPEYTDFDSDKNVGHAPLMVHFFDHCINAEDPMSEDFAWDFIVGYRGGYGAPGAGREPVFCYWPIGSHDVLKTASNAAGSVSLLKEDFIVVYEPNGYAPMSVVSASESHVKEPWDNAVDGDTYCWTGVATVKGDEDMGVMEPWAIFEFQDGKTKLVNKLRLLTDAQVGYEKRWARKVRISVQTEDPEGPFDELLVADLPTGGWHEFMIDPPVEAKYLKLVIEDPVNSPETTGGWIQLTEFEAYEDIVLPNVAMSTLEATSPHLADGTDESEITLTLVDDSGTPISVYDAKDVAFYLRDCKSGIWGPIDASMAAEGVFKTTLKMSEPGSYQVLAVAHGAVIGEDNPVMVDFFGSAGQKGALIFVEGSPTAKGEGWENVLDGDREGWDGTTTAKGDPCYAIFKFANDMRMPINKIGIATDNGIDDDDWEFRQVTLFEVQVSDDMENWTTVLKERNDSGEYKRFNIPTTFAKYVKLILHEPSWTNGGWRQIVEFEALFDSKEGFGGENATANIEAVPTTYDISQNYPNPFNPTTSINYQLPEATNVTLKIYNTLGQEVATLVDGWVEAGYHTVTWNAFSVPSGVYIYRMKAGSFTKTARMVLLK